MTYLSAKMLVARGHNRKTGKLPYPEKRTPNFRNRNRGIRWWSLEDIEKIEATEQFKKFATPKN